MCFSASASLSAGTVLLVVGTLALRSATQPRQWAFAAIPLLFAVQQFIEGANWIALGRDAPTAQVALTFAYVFFSHLLWPVWVPAAVLLLEPRGWRRAALGALTAAGLAGSGWLAWSVGTQGVVATLEGLHIQYASPIAFGPPTVALYVLATSGSMLLSSHRTIKLFGLLALLSFAAAYTLYTVWFVSVWCYFAALLSGLVLLHFRAPARRPARA